MYVRVFFHLNARVSIVTAELRAVTK
jgi:hypothetical protein